MALTIGADAPISAYMFLASTALSNVRGIETLCLARSPSDSSIPLSLISFFIYLKLLWVLNIVLQIHRLPRRLYMPPPPLDGERAHH